MAKKAAKAPRKQKLKVYRTPIGFHDAYVAAPSQKAALEAWGADSNLFAQGIAEQVDDPELMEEPLARPGEVIRRLRGSAEEQVAALPKPLAAKGQKEEVGSRIKSGITKVIRPKPRPPKPSRDELDAAEAALAEAERRQRGEVREIELEIQALERRRRDLLRRHERERDKLAEALNRARSGYERAVREWEKT